MDEQKKDAALDEETLVDVTGGGVRDWVNQAKANILGSDSANDNKEEQP